MRGAAPGKKTAGLQQKNVEVKTKEKKEKTENKVADLNLIKSIIA